ncbi:MAG: hypothetical protein V2B19_22430 [Pseudomonadota bacterium]
MSRLTINIHEAKTNLSCLIAKAVKFGFEDAMKAAYEDMYQDTRRIREKRKMMHMHKEKAKN